MILKKQPIKLILQTVEKIVEEPKSVRSFLEPKIDNIVQSIFSTNHSKCDSRQACLKNNLKAIKKVG